MSANSALDFQESLVNGFQPLLIGASDIDWQLLKEQDQKLIYMLSDPRPDKILCYIGQTNTAKRFKQHIGQARQKLIYWPDFAKPRLMWLSDILAHDLQPTIHILQVVESINADYVELLWIGLLENSPLHILVNGLDTRSTGATLIPLNLPIPTFNIKQGVIAKIDWLQEYWLGHHLRLEGYSTEGNCLLRHEVETRISDNSFQKILGMTITEYCLENLGETNFNNLITGMKRAYKRSSVCQCPNNPIEVRFSSYVPWRYKDAIPAELRQD